MLAGSHPHPRAAPLPRSFTFNPQWSAEDDREVCASGNVWGGTELNPRLPIDEFRSFGRQHYVDRSRQFANIMQRLDELERLGAICFVCHSGVVSLALTQTRSSRTGSRVSYTSSTSLCHLLLV